MLKPIGFSLIEITVVLVIISLLAVISYPLYTQHMFHSRRLVAVNQLKRIAVAMEQYYIEHHTYQGATLAKLGFKKSVVKNYRLQVQAVTANDYVLVAQPIGAQVSYDTRRAPLVMHANGVG
jgi:type IV pilus assembly protein PilE